MEKIKIKDVAQKLGKGEQSIRVMLQQGLLPFGAAVKIPGSSTWSYTIFPEKFKEYCGGVERGIEK